MLPDHSTFLSCRPRRSDSAVAWRVWAPRAKQVELVIDGQDSKSSHLMRREDRGYHGIELPGIMPGQRYGYSLDGGPVRPDPVTLFQPEGVHQPSALFFPDSYSWQHAAPKVRREDLILYELHVGTFTREGDFATAAERLPDLVELGINAVEVLPVAQFPGDRNWGYDGVHPFATQHSYGGPEAFLDFIDTAHGLGLAVFLDVVFNHLGPEGNYLSEFAPYFTDRHPTPWGPGFNFDGGDAGPVRDWVLECTWQWIHDFRLDGLRLDAVHAMQDESPKHILTEIKETADAAAAARGGAAIIIAESLLNDPKMVAAASDGGLGLDAEWNEDFHHAVSAWMTRESHGKYADYQGIDTIERVLRDNLHLTGQHSKFYGQPWGKPAPEMSGDRFVISLQNHDHIGNRARGERLTTQVSPAQLRLGACLTLLSPFLPMLFMGEEYGETNPFLFFCSFGDPRVIDGVRRGRKRDYALKGEVPDPQAAGSFESSVLSWDWQSSGKSALRELYRELIELRKAVPELSDGSNRGRVELRGESGEEVLLMERGRFECWFNLSGQVKPLPGGRIRWRSGDDLAQWQGFETLVVE